MKRKRLLPVQIPLPEGVDVDGAMFVCLPTLSDLERFWTSNKLRYSYAARGCRVTSGQIFLNDYEWVFATTKAGLVKAFTRWDVVGIQCVWHDWIKDLDPLISHEQWFADREASRLGLQAQNQWSTEDENAYQKDLMRRTPDTYRGWWTLKNLPLDMSAGDWLSSHEDLFDPRLPVVEATKYMQEFTYDSFVDTFEEIVLMDAGGVDDEIDYWLNEKVNDADYYGSENE
ncbi:hypothetical protein GCN74_26770 [Janthinobacterium sp. FT14W]|uniref:hypothetical protein n=1 Tax=Janthinobacterium sp. FT14W TaxID=2654253 RepID=UPI0012652305|nr:hypothetical protein [Janthinobacterium sp. FT14W]KAB8050752.1 hypothetical protein GCN74_26770 [Janthinobacterium sp. FT14W]